MMKSKDNADWIEVVHPLDDLPEQKRSYETLGRIKMTRTVKLSLMALRCYLLVMILLVFYRVFELAGVFGKH